MSEMKAMEVFHKMMEELKVDPDTHRHESYADTLIATFQRAFPEVRPGRVMRIKPEARYKLTRPGTLVFVVSVKIDEDAMINPNARPETAAFALNERGFVTIDEPVKVAAQDLEAIPLEKETEIIRTWSVPPPEYPPLFDGDPVELTEDVTVIQKMMFGNRSIKFPKGLAGIVDNPDLNQAYDTNAINNANFKPATMDVQVGWVLGVTCPRCVKPVYTKSSVGVYELQLPQAGHGFEYQLYVPKFRAHITVDRSQIKKRAFRTGMFDQVIMDDATRREILAAVMGNDEDLARWGVRDGMTKGKGTILLAYGPPGTGKTMTAEALAELLERPLYIVDSSVLKNTPEEFEEGVKEVIDRAKRWKAVVLLDEAEIYLQERGDDPGQNARVASMLRHLEAFEGILFMTTNRPVKLDFAIDSRIHAKVYYPAFDEALRKKIWKVTIPMEMLHSELESAIPALAKIELNGREIKTAILNAARTASYSKLDKVPAQFLVDAARGVFDASRSLTAARRDDWAKPEAEQAGQNGNGKLNGGHATFGAP